jgi:hypothetical protein
MSNDQEDSAQMFKKLKHYFLEREISNFYEYLNSLDEVMTIRKQEITANMNFAETKLSEKNQNDEHRKEFVNLMVEAEQIKGFTNLLRQSFLTSLYSFMELWLIRDCHLDSQRRDGGKSYKSIKKIGLTKVVKYFSSVMKNDYPFSGKDWVWITHFQLLRDCIVHRQGSLTGFSDFEINPTLAKFIDSEPSLSLFGIDNKQVFIEYDFCVKAMKTVERVMLELII